MATTALFVEILVIGAVAQLWIFTLFFAVVSHGRFDQLLTTVAGAKDVLPLLAVLGLALTYALGWIFNFTAERLFRLFGQRGFRDEPFRDLPQPYDKARVRVLLDASDAVVHEIRMDRHIIRLARANCLNFTLLALALVLHWRVIETGLLLALIVASLAAAVASFFQWLTRYRSYYKMMAKTFEIIVAKRPDTA